MRKDDYIMLFVPPQIARDKINSVEFEIPSKYANKVFKVFKTQGDIAILIDQESKAKQVCKLDDKCDVVNLSPEEAEQLLLFGDFNQLELQNHFDGLFSPEDLEIEEFEDRE